MHGTKEVCLENVYDKALDDGPMLLDNINCTNIENGIGEVLTLSKISISLENDQLSYYKIVTSGFEGFNPTIIELDKNYVFVDHENHALCDGYVVEFIHDATENYYERGKYGCRSFHGTRISLYMLKVLKLFLFYLPMLVTLFFVN